MTKPTIEKKTKKTDVERRIERANELLTHQYDSGTEMLHQCKEAGKMVMEACATVWEAENRLSSVVKTSRKQLLKYTLINLAFTAALIMVAVYVKG